jgi:hypothetical protein
MRKVLLFVSAAVITAGCASQETGEPAAKAEAPATETTPSITETMPAETMPAEAELATVSGTMGCAHCNFQLTPTCAAAVQTADGVVWILEGVDEQSELFQHRKDLGMVNVSGTQRTDAGMSYLAVSSYEVVEPAEGMSDEG